MLVDRSFIDSNYVPLKASDSVETAKLRMDQQEAESLPVIDRMDKLIGRVGLNQLQKASQHAIIADLDLNESIKAHPGQHFFDVARIMLQQELSVLPVVDDEWTFLGIITKPKVLSALTQMLNLAEFGSVITVELSKMDFTISEIVQIIEVEEAKILGLTVETPDEKNQAFQVSFKLNIQDVSRVTAALRRYGYSVFSEDETEVFSEDLESRAGELIKYIDM